MLRDSALQFIEDCRLSFAPVQGTGSEILVGVPYDEQAKIPGGNIARVYNFDVAKLTAP
jgi:hypothetical protein